MKSQRLTYAPTRSRRMNEIFGLAVLAVAGILLLALLSYRPTDPSFDTVGGGLNPMRPAGNWTGLLGAYFADLALQSVGVAVLLVPVMIGRVGVSWIRSQKVGAGLIKTAGLGLWLVFAPAGVALLPLHLLWKGALPLAGVEGLLMAQTMVHLVNAPGAAILTLLMIALSLYLATSFALNTAPEWLTGQFAWLRSSRQGAAQWQGRRAQAETLAVQPVQARTSEATEDDLPAGMGHSPNSLLSGLLQLFSRKKNRVAALIAEPAGDNQETSAAVWDSMPRTNVDLPVVIGLAAANAAAAPFAAQLAAAAAPLRTTDTLAAPMLDAPGGGVVVIREFAETLPSATAMTDAPVRDDDGWLDAPERPSFVRILSAEVPSGGSSPLSPAAVLPTAAGPRLVSRAFTVPNPDPSPYPMPSPFPDPAPMPAPIPLPPPSEPVMRQPSAPLPRSLPPGDLPSRRPESQVTIPLAKPSPLSDIRDQNIAFGARSDAHQLRGFQPVKSIKGYELPPSTLLHQGGTHSVVREDALRAEAQVLVEKCAEFGVAGRVEQINPGPVVTTYEFRPDAGVKYSRVTGLADDLCLAMAAESVLIERMAGKSTVGIQVPNGERETIWLRDVVESPDFASPTMRLPIALGKDIDGRIVTADLASMPHVLIAGSTGSGKSVAINAMIMSVLFRSTPEQVRMILVDPKRVELGMYEGIPHLFTPIITEAKLAANALKNAVKEMERRLKLLAANHVRNLDQFNHLFDPGSNHVFEDRNQEPLPYIIIVIDELADLMMLDRSNVEEAITRLAQMARAVGIHLVLATQRPSVDVITGLLKANVPTRMSFRLATKIDSRTIIDTNGAESLLGRGDMLFLPPGTSRLQRVHAPFVTEKEIAGVTAFWKAQGEAQYVEGFLDGPKDEKGDDSAGTANEGADADPMFDDAVRLVFEFGKASTSLLQRRLRIGYGRAAHLIDMMERDGLVGPADGSKPRELLKPPEYFGEVDAAIR